MKEIFVSYVSLPSKFKLLYSIISQTSEDELAIMTLYPFLAIVLLAAVVIENNKRLTYGKF